jgi:HK97 family phage major capsid protein
VGALDSLKARRAETHEQAKVLAEKAAAENRYFTEYEQNSWHSLNTELAELDEEIDRLTGQEQREAGAVEGFNRLQSGTVDRSIPGAVEAGGGLFTGGGGSWLPSWRKYKELESRAVGTGSNVFVGTEQSTIWFDRLRNASVFMRARPIVLPMHEGYGPLNVPRVVGSATAQMLAENTAITPSDPTLTPGVTLTARKATLFNLVSNEALNDSTPQLQEVLATEFQRTMASLLDVQYLTGNGTAPNLRGAQNFTGATVVSNGANGTQLSTQTNLDLFAGPVGQLQALNADMSRAAWFIHPLLWSFVRKIKDSQGRYQLQPWGTAPEQDIATTLFGIPVYISANLPSAQTVGTSTDCSTVILADMSQIVVGMAKELQVEMSRDYAFNSDQTAIRLIARTDVQPVNAAATLVINGLRAS